MWASSGASVVGFGAFVSVETSERTRAAAAVTEPGISTPCVSAYVTAPVAPTARTTSIAAPMAIRERVVLRFCMSVFQEGSVEPHAVFSFASVMMPPGPSVADWSATMPTMRCTEARPAGDANSARASATSAIEENRRAGSFSRQRRTAASRPAGTPSHSFDSAGAGSWRMLAQTAVTVSPVNGGVPDRSSCRMAPSDQMSARTSTSRVFFSCSGDMYWGEPMTVSLPVSRISRRAVRREVTFEMPKSSTLIHGVPSARREKKRFAGFRSRCTMPSVCASAIASLA